MAVVAEGGGKGGEKAAAIRQQLHEHVSPSWIRLMSQFDVRQLHFHLGPGSLSFLRIHRPNKFGDRMDDIRHIIVDTYDNKESNVGFETGRVYSGLRGTVPIMTTEEMLGEETIVGVLEVGTSFKTILNKFKSRAQVESIVLLDEKHVRSSMWPEFIDNKLKRLHPDSSCFIEATSSIKNIKIVKNCNLWKGDRNKLSTLQTHYDGRDYAITRIPLFDYRALHSDNAAKDRAGMVLVLSDITSEIKLHEHQFKLNILFAIFGFIIIEILLYIGLRLATSKFQKVIDEQTDKISELKDFFEDQSQHDGLTNLFNHRAFIERMGEEMHRTQRQHSPLTMMMLDLDHFKRLNDTYGHSTGDEVLIATAKSIESIARQSDIVGRYGGEEFCIALPDTGLEGAIELAERLLKTIRDTIIKTPQGEQISITTSIGISQWDETCSISDFIHAADQALYQAKERGRNQLAVAKSCKKLDVA